MKTEISIPIPCGEEVKRYLKLWDSLENYTLQESSLKKLFTKAYPYNKDLDDVLIKVCVLNDFYSTNIFSPFFVAKHIIKLDIDKFVFAGDLDIVDKIARVEMNGGKIKNFYSFATKYCSHHNPEVYPIYDSFVEKVLLYFKKKDGFHDFKKEDLRIYQNYKNILKQFAMFYELEDFSLKEIDIYLWQIGKEYFPKKY